MKWQFKVLLFLIILFVSQGMLAYSVEDLWIVEVVVNEDYTSRQIIEALVLQKNIFLPVTTVANLLEIPVNVDYLGGKLTFQRPGDQAVVYINSIDNEILVLGKELKAASQIYHIAGDFYLSGKDLSRLMDAQLVYNQLNLNLKIQTEHLVKGDKTEFNPFTENLEIEKELSTPAFSISNIQYNLTAGWQKTDRLRECDWGLDDWLLSDQQHEKEVLEEWRTQLNLGIKGTIYDWKYQLGSVVSKKTFEDLVAEIDQILLTYDLERAFFQLGTLNVQTEETVILEKTAYNGMQFGSWVSPLMRSNGNIIQVRGKAEAGSTVTLYVNGWKRGVVQVAEDEKYWFRDVVLYVQKRANELKIVMERSNGIIEEEYRYIAVSESIIDQGELNYLGQIGQRESQEKPYLVNGISYWGATSNTTLGMAWYGEFRKADLSNLFNYNAIRVNQRLGANNLVKGLFYQIGSNKGQGSTEDIGYLLNYDFQDKDTLFGLMYHKEGEQYHVEESERLKPLYVYKAYYLEDITPESFLQGKFTRYQLIQDPRQQEDNYELGFNVEKEDWLGMLGVNHNVIWPEDLVTNTYRSSISYHLLPELDLTNELEYRVQCNEEQRMEQMDVGIFGTYEFKDHQYTLGVNWDKNIDQDTDQWHYNLGWSKGWNLQKDRYLHTRLNYNLTEGDNHHSQKIPLKIGYTEAFLNDVTLNVNYLASWEKNADSEGIEHEITLSIEGACNFFGGKLVSTSPLSVGNQIGLVSGIVFQDSNRNGQYDSGEVLLAGIPVRLGTRVQFSDQKGEFTFKNITVGTYTLGFDYQRLPIELTPSLPNKKITVVANGETIEKLGVYVVGTVDGFVKIENAKLQGNSLKGIKIVAEPGGYSTLTDQSGYYFFDQLPAGKYRISLERASLPDWVIERFPQDNLYEIDITDLGEYITGIDFLLDSKAEFFKKDSDTLTEDIKIDRITAINQIPTDNFKNTADLLIIDLEKSRAIYAETELELTPFVCRDSNGVIWFPLRAIFSAFQAGVYWKSSQKQIHILSEDREIIIHREEAYAQINGKKVALENKILIDNCYSFITAEDLKKLGFQLRVENNVIYIQQKDENK